MISLAFFITAFIVVATPGTGVVYTLAAALSRGTGAGILAAFACTLGIVPHLLAAITGLAAMMHTSALAFDTLKYLGVAYLLYMAWGMWHDRSLLTVDENPPQKHSAGQVIHTGIILNLLNPKLTLFFFAFLPPFLPANSPNPLPHMLVLSAAFMLITFGVFALYAIFAARMRRFVFQRPKMMLALRKSFALTFVALGAKLAATSR